MLITELYPVNSICETSSNLNIPSRTIILPPYPSSQSQEKIEQADYAWTSTN